MNKHLVILTITTKKKEKIYLENNYINVYNVLYTIV